MFEVKLLPFKILYIFINTHLYQKNARKFRHYTPNLWRVERCKIQKIFLYSIILYLYSIILYLYSIYFYLYCIKIFMFYILLIFETHIFIW